ncbi:MAG: PHP domain-containing protein [Christensenellales bacterium]|jgi:hypothetical protein
MIPADLHIHSCLSPCGEEEMTPNNIVRMALIKGLRAIAVTDHNACANVPGVQAAAAPLGLTVIPGTEVTTVEDIHVLCYFPDYPRLAAFCAWLDATDPGIPNRSERMGRQVIRDGEDNETGQLPNLLITGRGGPLEEVEARALAMGGVAVPAHIDKSSNSILSVLGYIPRSLNARTVEVLGEKGREAAGFRGVIRSSDAHQLTDILEGDAAPLLPAETPETLIAAFLKGQW